MWTVRNPEHLFDLEIDFLVGKKQLGKIIDRCIKVHGTAKTAEVLDNIKAQGYKYSTKGAITVAVCDAVDPAAEERDHRRSGGRRSTQISKPVSAGA